MKETICQDNQGGQLGKPQKINNSYGRVHYYRFYKAEQIKNNKDVLSIVQFNDTFTLLTKLIRTEIINTGSEYTLPFGLGKIYLTKVKCGVSKNKNGTLRINYPKDYKATNDLWKSDPEAKKNRKFVRHLNRHSDGYFYRIIYSKPKIRMRYGSTIKLAINRGLKRGIAISIKNKIITDALLERQNE